jgi:hypothetical protein
VLLSYGAWQTRYGGRPDVLGQTVTLNDAPNVIIGVLPREFHFAPAQPADFWMSLHANNPCELRRGCHNLYGVARLRDGVSIDTASANIAAIASQLEQRYPDSNRGQGSALLPLEEVVVGTFRPVLVLLISGAGLLLLPRPSTSRACCWSDRRAAGASWLRAALGASSARVIAQFRRRRVCWSPRRARATRAGVPAYRPSSF